MIQAEVSAPAARPQVRVGTSGWHYKHWLGAFYPPKFPARRMLDFYAARFDAVELNNTFYRLPSPSAVEAWRESTPPDFRFAVKGSRFLTHMKKLQNPEQGIERFFERADLLGGKMGPVLWQLPPQWEANAARLGAFLRALPAWHRYAFEFRHESWNSPAVLDVLREFNAAYCIYELAGYRSPLHLTADAVYLRLHGPGAKYQGSYRDETLAAWAGHIREWVAAGLSVDVYFDNDDSGFAPANARALRSMIQRVSAQTQSG